MSRRSAVFFLLFVGSIARLQALPAYLKSSFTTLADDLCVREPSQAFCKDVVRPTTTTQRSPVKKEIRKAPFPVTLSSQNSIGSAASGISRYASEIVRPKPEYTEYKPTVHTQLFGITLPDADLLSPEESSPPNGIKRLDGNEAVSEFLNQFIPKFPEPPGGIENHRRPAPFSEESEDSEEASNEYSVDEEPPKAAAVSTDGMYSDAYSGKSKNYQQLMREFQNKLEKMSGKPARAHGVKTDIFADSDESAEYVDEADAKEGFVEEKQGLNPGAHLDTLVANAQVPITQLGLKKEEVFDLCRRFAPIAAQHCSGQTVQPDFLERCTGYSNDCAEFVAESKPLGKLANSFASSVGLTYHNWGVNGIPYYAINEEGAVGSGHNGRIDYGTYGGGYSDNFGVRDFWTQNNEFGANWYEGLYGYKSGWHVPIVQALGVEGGGGTHVHVPVKEGEFGKPIQVSNGYHVGPYFGIADNVGVDWLNGGVSASQGFAIPLLGVSASTGTSIGFPSIGSVMGAMRRFTGRTA